MRWTAVLLALVACDDFDLPSALTHPQIVAVRATPAQIPGGGEGRLDALVAGPDGPLTMPLAWRVVSAPTEVTLDAATVSVPPGASGEVVVELTAGDLVAEKAIAVGELALDNPSLVEVTIDDQVTDDEIAVAAGAEVSLAATVSATASSVSWYATIGAIEAYRHNPTAFVAPAAPASGWLIVVGRDGAGGVAWRVMRLAVE